jgi:hypothetical protein
MTENSRLQAGHARTSSFEVRLSVYRITLLAKVDCIDRIFRCLGHIAVHKQLPTFSPFLPVLVSQRLP